SALLLGHTLVSYHHPARTDLFGADAPRVCRYRLFDRRGDVLEIRANAIRGATARQIREGFYTRIDAGIA
ncbi:MAG: hypothetical protein ACO398_10910, partial [Kiritimatiellia bacterium]